MNEKRKAKLDVLRHKITSAKNIKKHLDIVSQRTVEEKKVPEKEPGQVSSLKQLVAKRRIIREKGFIQAAASMPAYKTSDHYQLERLNKTARYLDTRKSPGDAGLHGMIHLSSLKLAKRRIAQMIKGLLRDSRDDRRTQ